MVTRTRFFPARGQPIRAKQQGQEQQGQAKTSKKAPTFTSLAMSAAARRAEAQQDARRRKSARPPGWPEFVGGQAYTPQELRELNLQSPAKKAKVKIDTGKKVNVYEVTTTKGTVIVAGTSTHAINEAMRQLGGTLASGGLKKTGEVRVFGTRSSKEASKAVNEKLEDRTITEKDAESKASIVKDVETGKFEACPSGVCPCNIQVKVYEFKTDKGTFKIEAANADQAKRLIEEYHGAEQFYSGGRVIEEKTFTPQESWEKIQNAMSRNQTTAAEAMITYGSALGLGTGAVANSIPIRDGKTKQIIFMNQDAWDNLPDEYQKLILKEGVDAFHKELLKELPDKYQEIAKTDGLDAAYTQWENNRQGAEAKLKKAGFAEEIPDTYMQAYGSPPLREFTIPNMAQLARNNAEGMQILADYGFSEEVLETVKNFNMEASSLVNYIDGHVLNLSDGEVVALKRTLDSLGKLGIKPDMTPEEILEKYPVEKTYGADTERRILGRIWWGLDEDTKIAAAMLFDKDYTKKSYLSSVSKDLQYLSAKNIASQLALAVPSTILTPLGKKVTLEDAKKQLSKDFTNELSTLKKYVNKKDDTFDVDRLDKAMESDPQLEREILESTGYKNIDQLKNSLEYYNYGTTITSKEWAMAGLTAALVAIPFAGGTLSRLGVLGSIIRHGVPASLAAVMMPDTIRLMKDKKVSVPNKLFIAAINVALLSGAVAGTGKFAFRELRHLVKPGTFEASGVSLEVSIPRAQLKANMTPSMARTLVQDLERVWGTTLPEEIIKAVGKFKTPAEFQTWASSFIRTGVMATHIRQVATDITRGGIKGRANPFQASLNNNVLFSIKPDMLTYGKAIGKSKAGLDITPKGSMEWWSPNFSGDVAGWYLGKVKQFVPGGKILRFSAKDIRMWPTEIFTEVAKKMRNPKVWEAVKAEAKGDSVTAVNILVQREVYRRALLPPGHPDALPQGIYPVFKFHWSREPSGQLRPTWEVEMITPAGFKAQTFKPVRHLDKFKTGESATPEVASLTVRSPIEGRDLVSGQRIRLGQPMPIIIEATKQAIAEGKGLPTVRELYRAKFAYRPIAAIQNIFDRGKIIRPRATEASLVTTPRSWYSRVVKLDKLKANPADVAARRTLLKMPEGKRISTPEVAARIEGIKPDVQGRFSSVREPYYHPIREYADNWVVPRVGVMVKHPKIKGAYIVGVDTSSAAQPGVWDIIGGQIDTLGKVRVNRPFGRISLAEAAREQVLSEIGIRLKNVRPAAIHLGKTTEHSAFGTYIFDGTAASTKFKIPMNKWYDMVKGEWVFESEVSAIGVLKSGQKAMVTPALYVELARRGFDVSKLVVVDRGLPTAGIMQYALGTFERSILSKAKVYRPGKAGFISIEPLTKARQSSTRIAEFQKVATASSPNEFVVPAKYKNPAYTGFVPTLRTPMEYAPTMVIERTPSIERIPLRVTPPPAEMKSLTRPSYLVSTPKTKVTSYEPPQVVRKTVKSAFSTHKPTDTIKTSTSAVTSKYIPTFVPTRTPPRTTTKKERRVRIEPAKLERERIPKKERGLISWRQGQYYISIFEPFRTTGTKPDVVYSRHKPPWGKVVKGRHSPRRTLHAMGKVPKLLRLPMGVVTAQVKNGRKLKFIPK